MKVWFLIAATSLAESLAGATVTAQPPDLPLSKTARGAVAEVRQAIPRHLESIAAPLLDALAEPELGLSQEWRTHCRKDELTGETTTCRLNSPDYMPVSWEPDSSCRRQEAVSVGECAAATYGDATLGSQRLYVYCDGRVRTEALFTASRFMVGDEVVTRDVRAVSDVADAIEETDDANARAVLLDELEATQTLFTSPDGSWATKGTFAVEGTRFDETRKDVFRFVPDSAAIREFLTGPHCATKP